MAQRRLWSRAAALTVLMVVAVACGGDGEGGGGEELQRVVIRMDWTAAGYHAPFVLAQEKGYYAEEGLDVQVLEGEGSSSTSQTVAQGDDTFGFVQLGSAMTLVSQDAPIVAVAPIVQKSTTFIASRAEANIEAPADLEGKKFGYDPGGSDAQMVPLFLSTNGVDQDKVELITTSAGTTLQLMAQGRIDAATYESIFEIPIMEREGIEFNGMYFGDYGLNVMAYTIITNRSTIENDADMVERFVLASLRGWEDAAQNPQEAIDALAAEFPVIDAENALQQLELTIPLLHTDATEGMPIGCANEADIVNVETILAEAELIESPTGSADTYFTGEFAPC